MSEQQQATPRGSGVRRFFNNHWEKMVLWSILIGLFYLLRPFFLLIFVTFLVTYITRSVVDWLVSRTKTNYRLATVFVFFVFVGLLGVAGSWIGPRLIVESNQIVSDLAGDGEQQTREKTTRFVENLVVRIVGPEQGQAIIGSERYASLMEAIRVDAAEALNKSLPGVVTKFLHLVKLGWEMLITILLGIVFSFMLVWDWKRIGENMKNLEKSPIRTFYSGAAPHLQAFADVLGKALRAQAMIAAVNTVLTGLGLWYYHVPNIALLTTIVFICGFIPILGTFVSSVPILLFSIQVGGVELALHMVILIALVHAFEAYVLNPRITAGVLHAHPLLVLGLLLIGERFFGLWGLVVGVPIGYYVINVLTTRDDQDAED